MDDSAIQEVASALESDSKEGVSRLVAGHPADYVFLTANRAGLLKLASLLLRAATEPITDDDCRSKPISPGELITQVYEDKPDRIIGFIQRMETWPEPSVAIEARRRRAWKRDRLALLACGCVAPVLVVILAIGAAAVWHGIKVILP